MRTNSENQENSNVLDKIKWLLVFGLVALIVWGNFYFAEVNPFYQPNTIVRLIGVGVLTILAILLVMTTQQGKAFVLFAKESRTELRKVVWPTRKETIQTTLLISVITIIVGLCLWGLDTFFFWLISLLTTLGH